MATSNTNMSTWEPFSGTIPSAWGNEICVTIDDKLHMTETSLTQTIQGPMSFSNTSPMTFAGPFNNTSTSVGTFAGPFNNTSTSTSTFVNMDITTKLRIPTDSEFRSAITSGKLTIACLELFMNGCTGTGYFDTTNYTKIDFTNRRLHIFNIAPVAYVTLQLPDECVVTKFSIYHYESSDDGSRAYLGRTEIDGSGAIDNMTGYIQVPTSLATSSTTVISYATVDNGGYHYLLALDIAGTTNNYYVYHAIIEYSLTSLVYNY